MNWAIPYIINESNILPTELSSGLDVGCARGILGPILKSERRLKRLVGIDAFDPYLDSAKRTGAYDLLLKMDLAKEPLPFSPNEFDVIFCLEVIEHLQWKEALLLLTDMEAIGKRVIITSPTGYFPQGELEGNPFQKHQCIMRPRFLKSRGYQVRGINVDSFRLLGKPIGTNVLPPLLSQFIPNLGQQYIAWRQG
jgi:hypothetical protein